MKKLDDILVPPDADIRQVMEAIARGGAGIALLVEEGRRLRATITDGDVRRAILDGVMPDAPALTLLRYRPPEYRQPTVAPVESDRAELISIMKSKSIRHLPLVDGEGGVVDLCILSELMEKPECEVSAVIMAGGFGSRMKPLTEEIPKPMLPLGDRPLLELTIDQLRKAGIRRVSLTTHYKKEVITNHFGDGNGFGVEIVYVKEDEPLGTAGALRLLDSTDEPLLVINGDIVTRVDFRAMLDFHRDHKADMTIAVGQHEFRLPYGLVETNGVGITRISEKPVIRHFINAGIYLLGTTVRRYIPEDGRFDMPDLITRLIEEGCRVISFPVHEYWLDIGRVEDYLKAQKDYQEVFKK